jgi:hypothetical protein
MLSALLSAATLWTGGPPRLPRCDFGGASWLYASGLRVTRPQLRDPNDEMVREAAVNGRADALVTYGSPGAVSEGVNLRQWPGASLWDLVPH